MQLNPYLSFNGTCEEAFKLYQECLGGTIQSMMKWSESPMADQMPPELGGKIMHASLTAGETALLGADASPDRYEAPKGFYVAIQIEDTADAERIFQKLAEGGMVEMPLQQTFWAKRFGMLTDRFGINWMVNCGDAG